MNSPTVIAVAHTSAETGNDQVLLGKETELDTIARRAGDPLVAHTCCTIAKEAVDEGGC